MFESPWSPFPDYYFILYHNLLMAYLPSCFKWETVVSKTSLGSTCADHCWFWAGSHGLLFISSPLEVDFYSHPRPFTCSPSCCTSKHNLKYAFSMNPSKRKLFESHSMQFSQNFTFLRICWSGLCKISIHLKQTICPYE